MKGVKTKKAITFLIALIILMAAVPALALNALAYVHDPAENPEAMKDIVRDEDAVYGFRPSETGSLKTYADADWSDPETVEKGRQERIAYHNSIESMYDMMREMRDEGKSTEDIARAVSAKRNELRFESYKDDPEGLEALKARNIEKYGHEEGPLPDELYDQYGSWERVIEKAFSANVGMDACLGLYDDYYDLYVLLGQVGDGPTQDTDTETAGEDDTDTAVPLEENTAPAEAENTESTGPEETASAPQPEEDIGHVTPQTGDGSHTAVWVAVSVSSALLIVVLAVCVKKRTEV